VAAFEGVKTERTERGVVVLAEALAWLECEVAGVFETGGDHDLVVGRVIGGKLVKDGKPFVHVRGNGMRY
jgi:flavin reductase (DIM6/NTAB) family NADH-FMN oxidoreductase RutF